eukprot:SAG11_NODE_13858_length_636_cov_0.754190_2_plen_56_part_01
MHAQSTTPSRDVAIGFSKKKIGEPSTIFSATMMPGVKRAAFIGWLSQYPRELEMLY